MSAVYRNLGDGANFAQPPRLLDRRDLLDRMGAGAAGSLEKVGHSRSPRSFVTKQAEGVPVM